MQPSESPAPPAPAAGSARLRQAILLGLLLLMLGALWYDYSIARPAVKDAYQRIAQLNQSVNGSGNKTYMTEKDVQKELNRQPIDSFREQGYFVEVYGWRSGLPIKTHNYYAVYTDTSPRIFMTHSMNQFDPELIAKPAMQAAPEEDNVEVAVPRPGNLTLPPGAPPTMTPPPLPDGAAVNDQ